MANNLWIHYVSDKLMVQSAFSSTVKDSEGITGVDTQPVGCTFDGTNFIWTGNQAKKAYITSGTVTSTLKDSQSVSGIDTQPYGIGWDDTDYILSGKNIGVLYRVSGHMTATVKDSVGIVAVDSVNGNSWNDPHVPWIGQTSSKMYLQSTFTSTMKDSQSVSGKDTNASGISWDGTNSRFCGNASDVLVLSSGQFTGTIKDSVTVSGTDPLGISSDDYDPAGTYSAPFSANQASFFLIL